MNYRRLDIWEKRGKDTFLRSAVRSLVPPMPCTLHSFDLNRAGEVLRVDVFGRGTPEAVAFFASAAPYWAEEACEKCFTPSGTPA